MFSKSQTREVGAAIPFRALIISLVLHSAVLVCLCWQPEPMLIQRATVVSGENGTSVGVVYLPVESSFQRPVNDESRRLKYVAARKRVQKPRHTAPNQTDEHPTGATVRAPSVGSPDSDSAIGPLTGWGARPALPLNFPDPHVRASDLPPGVTGDVIVEVTIDAAGNITSKKILQSIGFGIDEKVLAVLENWRFTPATILGRPVASRQDVHFHFPS